MQIYMRESSILSCSSVSCALRTLIALTNKASFSLTSLLFIYCADRPREHKPVQCTTQKKRKKEKRRDGGKRIKGKHYKKKINTQGCFVQVLRGSGVDEERRFLVKGVA